MQMWIITGASDKLAQTTAGQSIVMTLLSGVLIANYQAATMLGNITAIIGIVFATIGGMYVAKFRLLKATSVWSWACIGLSVVMVVFLYHLRTNRYVKHW